MHALAALLIALTFAWAPKALAKDAASTLAQPLGVWHGEFFQKKQGGLYFKARTSEKLDGPVQVVVWDVLEKKAYSLSVQPGVGEGPPREIVKAPSGKYDVQQITMVDRQGVKRQWVGTKETRKAFLVKRQCISNLGLWSVAPDGKTGLKVSFDPLANSYKEDKGTEDSSVAVVLDGFTGLIQEKFGGKKVLEAGENDHGNDHELRAAITITRQIAMFYKLDLFKHNNHAQAIANVLSTYDPNIRRCYTDRLEWVESLKGDLVFTFLLSKQTGTMAKLKHTGGTINDVKMTECVYYELARISFPVPENMIGELTYSYDVK
jgi:hypothetical protein